MLVMHLISESSEISTSSRFRNSSGYVFLINFIGVIFEAGNETREKIWSDFNAEQNEERSEKRVVFCSYRCFEREREMDV